MSGALEQLEELAAVAASHQLTDLTVPVRELVAVCNEVRALRTAYRDLELALVHSDLAAHRH